MDRRKFIKSSVSTGAAISLAGCSIPIIGDDDENDETEDENGSDSNGGNNNENVEPDATIQFDQSINDSENGYNIQINAEQLTNVDYLRIHVLDLQEDEYNIDHIGSVPDTSEPDIPDSNVFATDGRDTVVITDINGSYTIEVLAGFNGEETVLSTYGVRDTEGFEDENEDENDNGDDEEFPDDRPQIVDVSLEHRRDGLEHVDEDDLYAEVKDFNTISDFKQVEIQGTVLGNNTCEYLVVENAIEDVISDETSIDIVLNINKNENSPIDCQDVRVLLEYDIKIEYEGEPDRITINTPSDINNFNSENFEDED